MIEYKEGMSIDWDFAERILTRDTYTRVNGQLIKKEGGYTFHRKLFEKCKYREVDGVTYTLNINDQIKRFVNVCNYLAEVRKESLEKKNKKYDDSNNLTLEFL